METIVLKCVVVHLFVTHDLLFNIVSV